MYVTMKEILQDAKKGGYAIIAPNIFDYKTAVMCVEAAEENKTPVIIDYNFGRGKVNREAVIDLGNFVAGLARRASVPVALNQDHGASFEHAILAINAGYSSIMVDRSSLPFEENVAQVKELTHIAHAAGLSVEAELGHVGFANNYEVDGFTALTEPGEAAEYVERTGIDCLAVAIGTAHGKYKGEPHIDFERLEAIQKVVDVPLVLHGGSSTGDERLARAARSGICKINIASDAGAAGIDAFKSASGRPGQILDAFYQGYKQCIVHYMEIFGQIGRA